MRAMMMVTCALALAGCASNVRWVRPGATAIEFDQDRLRCEYEAELAIANAPVGSGTGAAIASGISTGLKKVELMTLCLQTKGWTRQTVN